MRQQAMQFAENYKAANERLSTNTRGIVRHPSLYVFLGECTEAYTHIHKNTQETGTGGAFFARLFNDNAPSATHTIRAVKTDIQRNEAALNIKRVNIYVIAQASSCPHEKAKEAGILLKEIFAEDFPIVYVVFIILLSESNHWEDYEQRAAHSFLFLRTIADFQRSGPLYDLVFLLSDRNENDVVSDENRRKNYELIGHLHYLTYTESRFESNLKMMEMGGFVTAGMARLSRPDAAIAYAVFRHVYDSWLAQLSNASMPEEREGYAAIFESLTEELLTRTNNKNSIPDEKFIRDMLGVASRNDRDSKRGVMGRHAKSIYGKTLQEAEAILYGEAAARFFYTNYAADANAITEDDALAVIEGFFSHTDKSPYALTGGEPFSTDELLRSLESQIEQCECDAEQRYQAVCKPVLFQGIETVKRMIAEVYLVKYKTERLKQTRMAIRHVSEGLAVYAGRCRQYIKLLEAASDELAGAPDPGQHITAYYRQVVDGIISAMGVRHGSRFLLEERFIGKGPMLEEDSRLQALADKIAAFIHKHIFTHEDLQLSFDEDLTRRSHMMPDAYDSDFPPIGEFYRQLLSECDDKAALAASLQRYDGLLREKYYAGDYDGMLMNYARQLAGEYGNEAAYFLNDKLGFSVIRLAGGFTLESLTRYRTMVKCYEELHP